MDPGVSKTLLGLVVLKGRPAKPWAINGLKRVSSGRRSLTDQGFP